MAVRRGLKLDLDYAAAAQLVFDAYLDFLTAPVDPHMREIMPIAALCRRAVADAQRGPASGGQLWRCRRHRAIMPRLRSCT